MYFELAVAISAIMIILIAVVMDKFLYLQACPMCILTRYVFGLIACNYWNSFEETYYWPIANNDFISYRSLGNN